MPATTHYLGLDVHQDSITLAVAAPGPKGEVRLLGTISHDLHALEKALARLRKAHPGARVLGPLCGDHAPGKPVEVWGLRMDFGRLD